MTWPNDENRPEAEPQGWTAPAGAAPPADGTPPQATTPGPSRPDPAAPADPRPEPRYGQYAPQPPTGQSPPVGWGPAGGGQPAANPWGSAPGWQQPPGPAVPGPGVPGQAGGPGYPGYPGYPVAGYPGGPGMPPQAFQPPAAQPGIVPLRPLTMWEVFDGAFRAVRHNPKVMFGVSAVVVAVMVVLSSLITWYASGLISGQVQSFFDDALTPTEADQFSSLFTGVYASFAALPLTLIATQILTGLLIRSVSQSVLGTITPIGDVLRGSGRRLGQLVLFAVGSMLLVLAVGAAGIGLMVALGAAEMWALAVLAGLLFLVLYLVGACWFQVRTLLVPAGLMLEDGKFWPTVVRAWRLTRGRFWRLLGLYLLMSIITSVVAGVISVPFTLIAQIFLGDTLISTPAGLLITGIGSVIASTLTTAFSAGVVALAYIDARIRSEGLDVELARAAERAGRTA